ncbi:aldo/keto reductase [Acrocarpospora catenulata]|uniref:aldo/keto reductase n=1 Tax=Acrocarpospora catenulata TaxID=2836182 RepID=UPI001BD9C7F4|nr:aldo/keto reductase [Acrocarpospora catenulata]
MTPLCIGTSALASMPELYGYAVSAERAVATMLEVLDGEINFIDTSNGYGDSERRIGEALRARGGLPAGFVLATKVDPDPVTGDFSGDRVRASVAESLDRLGLDRLQLLYFHDPERIPFEQGMAPGGAVEALVKLREEGVVEHLGVAGGPIGLLRRYLATGAFEAVITHNRYTLVDRSAEPLLADAAERGIAVVNGAPYGGGMLVKGPDEQPKYAYRTASDQTRERVRAMQEVCRAHGIPLAAAALQFSLREPRIASTIVGITTPERVAQTLELASLPIPGEVWERLEPLAAPTEEWLD